MIKIALLLSLAVVLGYFIGNINFARIFAKAFAGKDITKMGSKNPGTMNMLRSRNFGEALLTLIFEAIKSGVPALVAYFVFEHIQAGFGEIAYFSVAVSVVLGHCYPVFYKYKGGKGVACTFGMFLFHHTFWWISLIAFAVCFVLFLFIKYAFIITLTFVISMSIYATVYFCLTLSWEWFVPLIVLIWLNFIFLLYMHRSNIKRLAAGKENEINFREKLFGKKNKEETAQTQPQPEQQVEKKEEDEEVFHDHGKEE